MSDRDVRTERHAADARRGRLRSVLVPVSLGAAAVGALALTAPEVLTATVSSRSTFLRVAGLAAALVLWGVVLGKIVPNRWARLSLVTVPVVAVSFWQLRPYYVDDVVDEAFPVAASPAADRPVVVAAPVEAAPVGAVPVDTAPVEAAPAAVSSGSFQGLTGHRGSGTATAYTLADGSQVVRFSDFDISNGPKLEVYLVPGADQRRPGSGSKVADLSGNKGDQNYDVPVGIDLASGQWTVLIWCAPFTVEVANATLA